MDLDLYMFHQVCVLLDRWRREGRTVLPVSVNLSRQHFKKPEFLYRFAQVAAGFDIPHGSIEFELTESIFFDRPQIETVKCSITQMHMLGFACSLDDFGAGFSSLGLLKEFDVDTIKLDRQFFQDMSSPVSYTHLSRSQRRRGRDPGPRPGAPFWRSPRCGR